MAQAGAFDDLTEDLEAGREPRPTCAGEEMASHLIVQTAQAALVDEWGPSGDLLARLPNHADDYDWEMATEVPIEDEDTLHLFDVHVDGIEDPEAEHNRTFYRHVRGCGCGPMRPWPMARSTS
ncbi:hypothetical protein AB0883_18110 [Micromonospora sp. NPDC047812]|uniref:hypothetical protein n=1 Tax=Micromonospora sp. NPDC047812 TaxID=3155742 RepID=UPI00345481A9